MNSPLEEAIHVRIVRWSWHSDSLIRENSSLEEGWRKQIMPGVGLILAEFTADFSVTTGIEIYARRARRCLRSVPFF